MASTENEQSAKIPLPDNTEEMFTVMSETFADRLTERCRRFASESVSEISADTPTKANHSLVVVVQVPSGELPTLLSYLISAR